MVGWILSSSIVPGCLFSFGVWVATQPVAWGFSLVGVGDQLLAVSGGLLSSYGVQAPLELC